ncbi:MAG: tRNA-binding protein [Sphingomonadales bacterium]|jgi:tRNA-binding protein
MSSNIIQYEDFLRVDLRVGTIVHAEKFPQARKPAYIVHVDFGSEIGVLKSSAQITELYEISDLPGKQVLGVVNFPKKQIGPIQSEFLLTGFFNEGGAVVLAKPEAKVPNGARLC